MKKMSNSWFEPDATGKVNVDLKEVIRYAQAHYGRHTDWYLRHRDGGIKCLVVLLTAELAIAGVCIDGKLDKGLATMALIFASVLSVALTCLSVLSCSQAYRAALEHALLVSKAAWAMGWCTVVQVPTGISDTSKCPAPNDETLYVSRYIEDARNASDTKDFTTKHMRKWKNTYFAAKWTLILLGAAGCLVAVGSVWAIWM